MSSIVWYLMSFRTMYVIKLMCFGLRAEICYREIFLQSMSLGWFRYHGRSSYGYVWGGLEWVIEVDLHGWVISQWTWKGHIELDLNGSYRFELEWLIQEWT